MLSLNVTQLYRNALLRSLLSINVAAALIRVESLIGDIHVNYQACRFFEVPFDNLHIENFQNDEHCESWNHFKQRELFDLINRLGLEEWVLVQQTPLNY